MAARTPKVSPVRRGRPRGRFTQARRIDALREILESHPGGVPLADLARDLRMTERSVRRYLAELTRDTEVESVAQRPGGAHVWRIKPSERGRAVNLRRTQIFGLLATRPLFEALRGSALYDEMDLVHRELLQASLRPGRASGRGDLPAGSRLHERFLFVPPAPRSYSAKAEDVDAVFDAVARGRALSYRTPPHRGPKSSRVELEPFALVAHNGALFCLGRARSDGALVSVRVEHMHEVRSHDDEPCAVPEDFSVDAFLDGDFGVAPPSPRTRVLVEFDASVAEDVRARRFHPTQRIALAADGRVRLTFTTAHLDAVAAWVLGYGPAARVIEPRELAQAVIDKLHATLERYTPPSRTPG